MPAEIYTPEAQEAPPAPPTPAEARAGSVALTLAEKRSVALTFGTIQGFEALYRAGNLLSQSRMVPEAFQGKPADCALAIEVATRLEMSPVIVMQNMYLVKGKIAWSGQFCSAIVSRSGLFDPLDYEWKGEKSKPVETKWGCRAFAKDRRSGKVLYGPWVDWDVVVGEGWLNKDGSKWKTMPEMMFGYRCASWWMRRWYPEGLAGLPTVDEVEEVERDITPRAAAAPAGPVVVLEPEVEAEKAAHQTVDAKPADPPAPRKRGAAAVKAAMAAKKEDPAPSDRPPDTAPLAQAGNSAPAQGKEPDKSEDKPGDLPLSPVPGKPAPGFLCRHCEGKGAPDGCPGCGVIGEGGVTAAEKTALQQERTAPAAAPAFIEVSHEQLVAHCQKAYGGMEKLPRNAIGDVMREFSVSFNRANAAIAEARKK